MSEWPSFKTLPGESVNNEVCVCGHTYASSIHRCSGPKREDGALTIKRMRIAELEAENERLRNAFKFAELRIRTLEADLQEARARIELKSA